MPDFSAQDVLAKVDGATLVLARLPDGKIRVGSASWEDNRVILADQVLEIRRRGDYIVVLRKPRVPDDWDREQAADPYTGKGEWPSAPRRAPPPA